jgi:hypothetical protein
MEFEHCGLVYLAELALSWPKPAQKLRFWFGFRELGWATAEEFMIRVKLTVNL